MPNLDTGAIFPLKNAVHHHWPFLSWNGVPCPKKRPAKTTFTVRTGYPVGCAIIQIIRSLTGVIRRPCRTEKYILLSYLPYSCTFVPDAAVRRINMYRLCCQSLQNPVSEGQSRYCSTSDTKCHRHHEKEKDRVYLSYHLP